MTLVYLWRTLLNWLGFAPRCTFCGTREDVEAEDLGGALHDVMICSECFYGGGACLVFSCPSKRIHSDGFCFKHLTHGLASCGPRCGGCKGHPGACDS